MTQDDCLGDSPVAECTDTACVKSPISTVSGNPFQAFALLTMNMKKVNQCHYYVCPCSLNLNLTAWWSCER